MSRHTETLNLSSLRRRAFLKTGLGLGTLPLASLLSGSRLFAADRQGAASSARGGVVDALHFAPTAKRVIFMHMLGAVSQVDTFDYKPTLIKMHGQEIPPSVKGNSRVSTMVAGQTSFPIVQPLAPFKQRGNSGAWVSDLLPYTAAIADDLCFIKSMTTTQVNHDPASKLLHTGFQLPGRPSEGAWVSYGLGSENQNLPAFVVFTSLFGPGANALDTSAWGSGFLPSQFQGVPFRSGAEPVLYLQNPAGVDKAGRRGFIDFVDQLAKVQYGSSLDEEIPSKISQYEMAFRMQTSVPEVANISDEPDHILDMYGPDVRTPGTFARNCLLARRLAERDVRFISIVHSSWDDHFSIALHHPENCLVTDQPSAALVTDLKQRGLLKDTLVIWGSEFGRTSFAQGNLNAGFGRDHHGECFTHWLAGGGIKAGYTHGETDDFSYNVTKDPVEVYDLQATLLRTLGIDHERLTFKSQGRDFRLTDVQGRVVKEILA